MKAKNTKFKQQTKQNKTFNSQQQQNNGIDAQQQISLQETEVIAQAQEEYLNDIQEQDYQQSQQNQQYDAIDLQEKTNYLYYERIKEMQRNLDLNEDNKSLELRQIELEEMYIGKLREQRQRMEQIKLEFEKKQKYINELERKVAQYDYMEEQYNQIKKKLNDSLTVSEDSVFEISKLKKEIQILEQKVDRFKNEISEKDLRIQHLYQDQMMYLKQGSEVQEQIEKFKQKLIENETQFHLQLEQKNLQMQQLIEENNIYTQKKIDTDSLIYEIEILKTQNAELEREIKKFTDMYQHEKKQKEEAMNKLEKLSSSNNLDIEKNQKNQQQYLKLINELQEELDKHNQLLKKQEETISEFRKMKQQDERKLLMITTEMDLFQKEIEKLTLSKKQQRDELLQYKFIVEQKDNELKSLKASNQELKAKIMQFSDNSIYENRIKKDLNKIKEDLIQARSLQIDKYNENYCSNEINQQQFVQNNQLDLQNQ
ncbi:hypothetical protein TTHERM_00295970 (macronuclear) [Tetrahymena thermophila SB210]|uniref:Uncharacterized protein n=1 Tax=Tetrahymena thermophila (strain SB210) TaxID=312017 RepID=I7M7H0_TETTS|nr:hypothetical protein TTHERM_00295970 [Tetrahymena thermophila SB210]EAR92984.2 hypothetical protein TTHERM_00295970 [Tetrahymena thermophila SB210]|eukprot:XP_001013229.2 hypothetical protein TTHERM_00295970 [Tetrahymena thermophila SB210]